jgi:hypothetical protein
VKRIKRTPITDTATVQALILMQQKFVDAWNHAELSGNLNDQNCNLPGGATYSGWSYRGTLNPRTCSFHIPGDAWITFTMKAPWWHWHDGWSFCRHRISWVDQVRSIVVYGPIDAYREWAQRVGIPVTAEVA